jgi:DNA polymerase-3 subunit alpha
MKDSFIYLEKKVYQGAKQKKISITDAVLDQIKYELTIIKNQNFTDYFILYFRIIAICNELRIIRSYNRGSSANSLINFCLDITKINPLIENFVFERFILPNQSRLPDIDIDIPKGYKELLINKLNEKYPEYYTYYLALIPDDNNSTYKDIFLNKNVYKTHPNGIIITTKKISNAIYSNINKKYNVFLDDLHDKKNYNKCDFIELNYLKIFEIIIKKIGDKFHPYNLPLNDKKVFNLFKTGDLNNIFQFNKNSTKEICKEIKPDSIYDLSLINAMYRPGLIQLFPKIIFNKFNDWEKYSDLRLNSILNETYGCLIYQETFLQIVNTIAGITYSEAEIWRRKIKNDQVQNFEDKFYSGCRLNSSLKEAEIYSLLNLIKERREIFFQKAHSLSYSIIAYWAAYYKLYFNKEFDNAIRLNKDFEPFELY